MNKILLRILNLKLKTKILLIIIIVIILLSVASLCSLLAVTKSENQMLFKAVSGSLNYSADDIGNKISETEYMSSSIVSNSIIRSNLITLDKEKNSKDDFSLIRIENAQSSIETSLSDFHQTYKNNNLLFVNIYYGDNVISSYDTAVSSIPQKRLDTILDYAHRNSGYPTWITDFCFSDGILYLARDCRQVEDLKFRTLGTVIVGINMDRLIEDSNSSVLYTDNVQYALFQEKELFYLTDGITIDQIGEINDKLGSNYSIITSFGERFFCIRGEIEDNSWSFICLIPYNSIYQTINFTLWVAFAFILVVVLIAYLISRGFTKSVNNDFVRLIDKMNAFGNDESQIPISPFDYSNREDEIGLLHKQFDKMAYKIRDLIQLNYVNEILAKDAKLKALESQINPHFLYNTLETVNWRAKAIGEKQISSMVEALGMLLRETLSSSNDCPTLAHELEIVRNYLTIQKIRYEDRLNYNEDINQNILSVKLPHLTLQPLVENAINYAIEENTEDCSIQIKSKILKSGDIELDVINSNSQFPPNLLESLENNLIRPHGFGIGIINIHKRLQLIYGQDYGLTLFNLDEDHAVARIQLPGGSIC